MSDPSQQPEAESPSEGVADDAASADVAMAETPTPAADAMSVQADPPAESPVAGPAPTVSSDVSGDAAADDVAGSEASDSEEMSLEEAEALIDDEPAVVAPVGPIEEVGEDDEEEDIRHEWYILKVQSNRERTSSEALKRKVAIEGLDRLFGEIIVPTEKVTEFKNGKKKTVERKIWPGYIAVQMHVNEDTWFAIRETSGIGDFTGASGKPVPMDPADVAKILPKEEGEESEEDVPKLNIKFAEGDKIKVTDGNFESFEGDVDSIDQHSGKVTVMISIFGRSTPVELEYWQVEKL